MSLDPAKYNFTIWKDATFRKRMTLYQSGSTSNPRDLTGYTAALGIKDKVGGISLLSLTTANGGITLGGLAGTIDLLITAAQTTAQTWQHGVYDLLITAPGPGDTDPILYGTFSIRDV